ncbi:MAG: hypothetical protein Q9M91_02455 [Candidatus Dojkabacteria bacterium]|nr:hypothetical protein [Candidatus Dojkabacteria bacterium]MDQ7020687.1 hypothetical protein [Candidatus Dojkabacteria bacterium]
MKQLHTKLEKSKSNKDTEKKVVDISEDKDLEQEKSVTPFTVIYSWSSRERYWELKDRAWFVTYSFFFVILIAIAVMLNYILLAGAIISFVFLWFIQASIEPETVIHEITPLGIKTYDKLFKWKDIQHFWFSEKHGIRYVHLDVPDSSSSDRLKRFTLLVEERGDQDIFEVLIRNLDYADTESAGINIFSSFIHGRFLPISEYLSS